MKTFKEAVYDEMRRRELKEKEIDKMWPVIQREYDGFLDDLIKRKIESKIVIGDTVKSRTWTCANLKNGELSYQELKILFVDSIQDDGKEVTILKVTDGIAEGWIYAESVFYHVAGSQKAPRKKPNERYK